MNIYFEEIKKKLANKIKIEHLEIVDNSNKHKSHKYFSPGKFHLHLKIKSLYFETNSNSSLFIGPIMIFAPNALIS